MNLTAHLSPGRRDHVEGRLRSNQIAWLTTVRPDGRPVTVPVWFLVREDDTILIYSQPKKIKLRNLEHNPHVSLVLDMCDLGRDIIRIEGTAREVPEEAAADATPEYVRKYAERIGTLFGTPRGFAEMFSEPIVMTPAHLRTTGSTRDID